MDVGDIVTVVDVGNTCHIAPMVGKDLDAVEIEVEVRWPCRLKAVQMVKFGGIFVVEQVPTVFSQCSVSLRVLAKSPTP